MVLLSDKHPIDLTIGQELPPTFHYAWVILYQVATADTVNPMGDLGPIAPVDAFSTFAVVGPTAYFGLLDLGEPKAGETVVVSAAAGAVGSIVGQIAKIKGCRAVGLAGTAEKCDWITGDLGFDAAINYRTEDVPRALADACPNGVDIYFDNVGGEILDACLKLMKEVVPDFRTGC